MKYQSLSVTIVLIVGAIAAGCSSITNNVNLFNLPSGASAVVGKDGVTVNSNMVANVESSTSVTGTNGIVSAASEKSSGTLAIGINNSMNVPKTTNPNTTVSLVPQ